MRYISLRRNYIPDVPFSDRDLLEMEQTLDSAEMGIKIESTLNGALIIFDTSLPDSLVLQMIHLVRTHVPSLPNPTPDMSYVTMTNSFDRQTDYFDVGRTTYHQIMLNFVQQFKILIAEFRKNPKV